MHISSHAGGQLDFGPTCIGLWSHIDKMEILDLQGNFEAGRPFLLWNSLHDVLCPLGLKSLCLQRAACQIGIDAGHGFELRQVDLAGQLFQRMRPLQAVHDRSRHNHFSFFRTGGDGGFSKARPGRLDKPSLRHAALVSHGLYLPFCIGGVRFPSKEKKSP